MCIFCLCIFMLNVLVILLVVFVYPLFACFHVYFILLTLPFKFVIQDNPRKGIYV